MKMETLIAILIASCLMGGCAGTYTKQNTGTAIGALSGGALAYGLGKDSSNKDLWTVLGIGVGAMVGNNIGAQLDERDLLLANQTFQSSLEHNKNATGQQWKNPDNGHSGTVIPVKTYQTDSGQYCREFQQTITVGNKTQDGWGTACRQPDGSWKII